MHLALLAGKGDDAYVDFLLIKSRTEPGKAFDTPIRCETLYCSLAVVVESMNITIAYTIGVYMVRDLLKNSADQSRIATFTGLLVSLLVLPLLSWQYTTP